MGPLLIVAVGSSVGALSIGSVLPRRSQSGVRHGDDRRRSLHGRVSVPLATHPDARGAVSHLTFNVSSGSLPNIPVIARSARINAVTGSVSATESTPATESVVIPSVGAVARFADPRIEQWVRVVPHRRGRSAEVDRRALFAFLDGLEASLLADR